MAPSECGRRRRARGYRAGRRGREGMPARRHTGGWPPWRPAAQSSIWQRPAGPKHESAVGPRPRGRALRRARSGGACSPRRWCGLGHRRAPDGGETERRGRPRDVLRPRPQRPPDSGSLGRIESCRDGVAVRAHQPSGGLWSCVRRICVAGQATGMNTREPSETGRRRVREERRVAMWGRAVRGTPVGRKFVPGVVGYGARCVGPVAWYGEIVNLSAAAPGGPRKCAVKFLEQGFRVFVLVPALADWGHVLVKPDERKTLIPFP